VIGLIGQPYSKDFNCWTVIEKYHGMEISVPEDILTSPKAKVCFIKDMKHQFTQLDSYKEMRDGDVILHNVHVALYINNAAGMGIIHAVEPYSEFYPVDDIYQIQNGLNGFTLQQYGKPTFWRLNKCK